MMTTSSRKVNQTEGKEVALEGSNMVALEGKMMALRCSMVAIKGKKSGTGRDSARVHFMCKII